MSDRMTGVRMPGNNLRGFAMYGRKTRAEAIAEYRAHYRRQLQEAEQALSAPDSLLVVETYLGPYAQRNREEVKE